MDTGRGWFSYLLTSAAPLFLLCRHHHRHPPLPPFPPTSSSGHPLPTRKWYDIFFPVSLFIFLGRSHSSIYLTRLFPFSSFSLARTFTPCCYYGHDRAIVSLYHRHHRHPRHYHRLLVTFPVHAVLSESFAQSPASRTFRYWLRACARGTPSQYSGKVGIFPNGANLSDKVNVRKTTCRFPISKFFFFFNLFSGSLLTIFNYFE